MSEQDKLNVVESAPAAAVIVETDVLGPDLTPKQIVEHLDKYIIGQDNYKKRLSVAAAYHFAVVKKLGEISPEEKAAVKRFRKKKYHHCRSNRVRQNL